jgi:hypothetical protein
MACRLSMLAPGVSAGVDELHMRPPAEGRRFYALRRIYYVLWYYVQSSILSSWPG